jgi:type VI secretion system protein ImpA
MDTTPYNEPLDPMLVMQDPALGPWLVGLDESEPCGPDLEYDNDFLALSQAAAGKPETQFSPAEPPDWLQVRSLAESLNERTRDLRVARYWLRARLRTEGFATLAPCLRLFEQLMVRWWNELHPRPDDGDVFARLNVLAEFSSLDALLGDVRQSWLLNDRAIGQISVRDVEIAQGLLIPRDDESPPSRGQIESMLADAVADNPQVATQCSDAVAALDALAEALSTRVGYGEQPDFEALRAVLRAVESVSPSASGGGDADSDAFSSDDDSSGSSDDGGDDEPAPRRGRSRGASGGMGSIESREDAVRAIGLVCDYLERNEPTNPASNLLRRAQRLIDRNFLQLVREFAPDALGEVARILGVDPDTIES